METVSGRLYGVAARMLALAMAGWTAFIVLFSPTSLAARIAGDSLASDVVNSIILAVCVLGWADIIWHDLRGKLIWPTFPAHLRHRICVGVYASLAGLTGIRAFVAAGLQTWETAFVGVYYVICAAGIGIIAVALTLDPRHGTR
jgi:hypothetical protein